MDVRCVRAGRRPIMTADEPHRAHAERMRRLEIARHILDHHRAGRIDAGGADETVERGLFRLRHEISPYNVENLVEMMPDAIGVEDILSMGDGAVGEDMLAHGQRCQHRV